MTHEAFPLPYDLKVEVEMALEKIEGDPENELFVVRRLFEKIYTVGYQHGKMAQVVESHKDYDRKISKITEAVE